MNELRERSGIRGLLYCDYEVWHPQFNPRPENIALGPALTPGVAIYEILPEEDDDGPHLTFATNDSLRDIAQTARVHVQHALIPANAPWEPPTSDENRKGFAIAEYICALVNADRVAKGGRKS